MDAKKRRGRPTKQPTPGDRVSLGLRVTANLKERLDRTALASGRSQSQEAELRLERSFIEADLATRMDEVAHGRDVVGLLMLAERAMLDAGRLAANEVGSAGDGWLRNAYAFGEALKAFNEVAETFRPPATIEQRRVTGGGAGSLVAASLIQAVADPASQPGLREFANAVRERLGPLVERIPPLKPHLPRKGRAK